MNAREVERLQNIHRALVACGWRSLKIDIGPIGMSDPPLLGHSVSLYTKADGRFYPKDVWGNDLDHVGVFLRALRKLGKGQKAGGIVASQNENWVNRLGDLLAQAGAELAVPSPTLQENR
jgi:hypothetical protein